MKFKDPVRLWLHRILYRFWNRVQFLIKILKIYTILKYFFRIVSDNIKHFCFDKYSFIYAKVIFSQVFYIFKAISSVITTSRCCDIIQSLCFTQTFRLTVFVVPWYYAGNIYIFNIDFLSLFKGEIFSFSRLTSSKLPSLLRSFSASRIVLELLLGQQFMYKTIFSTEYYFQYQLFI